jgi:hypothetical protein
MKKIILALSLALPFTSLIAAPKASKASKVAVEDNPFTPARNAASGNLSTTLVIMQKMAKGCVGKGDVTEERIKTVQTDWQNKNKVFLQVHNDYLRGYFSTIKEIEGDEALKKANSAMVKLVNEQADKTITAMTEKYDLGTACLKYFNKVASGTMDIKEGYPDYKVWRGMVEYSGGKVPASK